MFITRKRHEAILATQYLEARKIDAQRVALKDENTALRELLSQIAGRAMTGSGGLLKYTFNDRDELVEISGPAMKITAEVLEENNV